MKNPINYRSLIKQVYRYTRPRNYRHSEKLWPYIGIKRDADGCFCEPRYLGKAIPVLSLDDVAAVRADDLVIVASGPSINQLDLTALLQADWMAVNGSPSVLERYPNKPLQYYAVIDQGFVQDRIHTIAQVLANPQVVFFTNLFCLRKIYELIGYKSVVAKVVIFEDRQKAVYLPKVEFAEMAQLAQDSAAKLLWRKEHNVGFTRDMYRGYVSGGTVVYFALQIAAALGYKRVFLAGVDMKNFDAPRFYENEHNRLETRLHHEFDHTIRPSFALAAEVFRELGIEGYNLCLDSGLDDAIFPRIDLTQFMSLQDAKESK
ncbi:MAG: hypothetical protein KA221_05005 [Vitreoscilla sp.]|jgi:Kdo-III transferase WaaZ|nr:hypothetical protein [Vitreoscilla sp.]